MNINKTLCERIFGRGRTKGMIFWTCLTAAKELWSYLTREDKSFTPLVCWTTQLIQQGRIYGEGAGGVHPLPPWDDLRFPNTTGILHTKKLCGLLVLKYSKRRVHPFLKKILDPPLYSMSQSTTKIMSFHDNVWKYAHLQCRHAWSQIAT